MKTKQELFDKAYRGVMANKEGKCGERDGSAAYSYTCVYLKPNGDRCGAGHLIDDVASVAKVQGNVFHDAVFKALVDSGVPSDLVGTFVRDIQTAHDHSPDGPNFRDRFRESMWNVAKNHGLLLPED
jgi:hypothetical protein